MKTKTLLAGLGLCLLAACSISKEELIVDKELDYCNRQVHRTLDIMRGKGGKIDYTMMPRNILDGSTTGIIARLRKMNGAAASGRVFCGMITSTPVMKRLKRKRRNSQLL